MFAQFSRRGGFFQGFGDLVGDDAEYFQHHCDQYVELYQDNRNPKRHEEDSDPNLSFGFYGSELVNRQEPVVDDHLMEECYHWAAIVIEIQQVPQRSHRIIVIHVSTK